ncbi:MAG TPA: hypothetical protein PLS22_12520 [Aquabacterium sp.]|nr:hypothetical protein [Aquabacterium sp.]
MSNPSKPHAVYLQDRSAAPQTTTRGWVRGVYQHAIEYTTFDKGIRGAAFLFGGILMAAGAGFAAFSGFDFYDALSPTWFDYLFVLPSSLIFLFIGIFALIHYGRREFFRPLDLPIIFDRQRRKVYRIDQTPPLSVFSAFKPWPIRYLEYDWDDIVAEHGVVTFTTGSSAHRQHTLALMVRDKNAGDFQGPITPDNTPPYVDGFVLGDPKTLSELTVPLVWEHVRRYMNENGPALPPGEQLADTTVPVTWWDSLGAVSVFGPGYVKRWRDGWGWMVIMHLLSPLTLPLAILMATTNWASYKTAYPVQWPQEVLDKVGPSMKPSN